MGGGSDSGSSKGFRCNSKLFFLLGGWLREHFGAEGSPGRVISSNGRRQGLKSATQKPGFINNSKS